MFEIIDSKYTRDRYKEIGFQLTDFQKATLIWNKPKITQQERLSALKNLAINTADSDLRFQIGERIAYEEKVMKQFKAALYGEMLYVVFDSDDNGACGYFGKYETALIYAQNYINKEKTRWVIEKHQIINGNIIPKVKTSCRLNPDLFTEKQDELVEYSGDAVACLYLDGNANITNLWSNELDEKENKTVDEFRRDRFEYQFLALPYIHHEGLPVRYIPTGEYGIIETSADEWNRFLDRVNNGLFADYSDSVLSVYFLTEKGYWSHQHCNPIYLEVEMPEMDSNNEKQYAFYRAMDAMSGYIDGHKNEAQENLVLRTALEYADICEKTTLATTLAENSAKNAKSISDILW